ncbi:MAG: S9 family peptidase [Melioribacteraceae bacterium]|nr:S9 family peptidase [Melioribacteraceae bacterium]
MKNIIWALILTAVSITAQDKRPITVEDMWAMKRVESISLSPDGKTIAFTLRVYDMENNSGQSDIWLVDSDGSDLRPFKNTNDNESQPRFHPDSKRISFIKKGQLWISNLDGSDEKQLTDFYTGVAGVRWALSGDQVLFSSSVYPDCKTQVCNKIKDEEKANSKVNVKVYDELLFRHWDEWRSEKRSHLFVYDIKNNSYTDLNLNCKFDVPTIALGSSNDYNISPDGKEVAFTMNNSEMLATSTNNDIFLVSVTNPETGYKKISVSEGSDNQPVYSPDGKFIAYTSMARAGFEADKRTLMIYDRSNGKLINLSGGYDISVGEFIWSPDSKTIYYTAANEINNSIFLINVSNGENKLLLKERYNASLNISPDGKTLYFRQQKTTQPYEIFSFNNEADKLKQLTYLNKELLSQLEMNETETFWSPGAEGAKVQSILVKPPLFNPAQKYPMIFIIHGGPQGHTSDQFHYRWNLQLFASKGYVVVAPNPRGSTGYGQKFTDEISKDWGGKVYTDLMNAYDYAVQNYGFIDAENTFAAGASYGGYMIAWIEGHTDRFNALLCHDGVYNLESMYGSTEELWFPEWENGGAPWESKELYRKWSPSEFVENFKTPMLVVQGGKDFRVPETQAFELFTALQKMGVESKFVYFPEENHFVLKPQNSGFWWDSMFDWFAKFYKE